jgi:hypothetical protein
VTKRTPNFAKILAPSTQDDPLPLTTDEAGAIVAIAYHMATANGDMSDDERGYWDALVDWLAARTDAKALAALVERLVGPAGASTEENIRAFAGVLKRRPAREVAYKATYALRVWDLESNPAEEEVDELLVEVLDLGDSAPDLASEVNEALME